MKILHTADLHVCEKHHKWVDRALSDMVRQATVSKIDAWVIAGDSFDSEISVHTPAFHMFVRHVVDLAEIAPGIILCGTRSHDWPGVMDVFKEIPTYYPIFVADEPTQICLEGSRWVKHSNRPRAVFSCMPSLNKADPEIMDRGARAVLQGYFDDWRTVNQSVDCPTVLITHGEINGCHTESGYAMVSPDWEFSVETLYSAGAEITMVGHVHAFQSWYRTEPRIQQIAYCGSLARLVYGDLNPKGFLIWDTDHENLPSFEFIESNTRKLLEIAFEAEPDMEELEHLAKSADEDTFVRIIWETDKESTHNIDKDAMRKLFAHAGGVKLAGVVHNIQSVRSEGISRALTLHEKIHAYLITAGEEDRLGDLEPLVAMVETMGVDDITQRVLS